MGVRTWLMDRMSGWLNTAVDDNEDAQLVDFERLCEELHQGDVLLVEGRTRVSHVIKSITNSPWTHSVLYIGRLDEIRDESLQEKVSEYYQGESHEQLIIESMLGEGTVIYPVTKYKNEHLRIYRRMYRNRDEVRADVFDYIEHFYNPRRRHSTLGYLSPMDYERQAMLA